MSEYIELKNVTGVFVNPTTKSIIVTGIPEPDDESHNCDEMGCTSVEHTIYRFDADQTEVQRLRVALEKARQYIVNGYELGYIDDREGYTEALVREIDKALSTTTEPTNAAKVERVREGDGNDA